MQPNQQWGRCSLVHLASCPMFRMAKRMICTSPMRMNQLVSEYPDALPSCNWAERENCSHDREQDQASH